MEERTSCSDIMTLRRVSDPTLSYNPPPPLYSMLELNSDLYLMHPNKKNIPKDSKKANILKMSA